jgi:predicted transcriptional regulator
MELLSLLWEQGAVSLSEAHDQLPGGVAYTTVQTRLNRLVEKGLATRQKVGRQPLKYEAAVQPEEVSAGQLSSLLERVTGGFALAMVAQLVQKTEFSASEMDELKQLVREAERRSQKGAEQ